MFRDCWARYRIALGPAVKKSRVGTVDVGMVAVDGVEGGMIWTNPHWVRFGSWVPQQAFLSIESMLTTRMTPWAVSDILRGFHYVRGSENLRQQ